MRSGANPGTPGGTVSTLDYEQLLGPSGVVLPGPPELGSLRPQDHRRHGRPQPLPAVAAAERRETRRSRTPWQPARVRGAGRPLPGAAARILPAHAVLQGG